MGKKLILLTTLALVLALSGSAVATHIVFNGSHQNNWSGISTTSFGGETVMDLTGTGSWFWKNCSNSSAQDLSVETTWHYEIYCDGTGDKLEWHITAPDGQEWNSTYQWLSPLTIDGVPDTVPYEMSQDTWHTIQLDCSAQSWWSSACSDIRYIKWQWPEARTAYIRKVQFVSE